MTRSLIQAVNVGAHKELILRGSRKERYGQEGTSVVDTTATGTYRYGALSTVCRCIFSDRPFVFGPQTFSMQRTRLADTSTLAFANEGAPLCNHTPPIHRSPVPSAERSHPSESGVNLWGMGMSFSAQRSISWPDHCPPHWYVPCVVTCNSSFTLEISVTRIVGNKPADTPTRYPSLQEALCQPIRESTPRDSRRAGVGVYSQRQEKMTMGKGWCKIHHPFGRSF